MEIGEPEQALILLGEICIREPDALCPSHTTSEYGNKMRVGALMLEPRPLRNNPLFFRNLANATARRAH
jgi:hypothetical protein